MSFLLLLQLLAADPVFHLHELPFTLASGEGPRKYLPGTMPGGVAILDFDGDGLPDLFFANGAELPSLSKSSPLFYNRLYRNLGNWEFADVTAASGFHQTGYAMGAAAAAYQAIPRRLAKRNPKLHPWVRIDDRLIQILYSLDEMALAKNKIRPFGDTELNAF